MNGHHLLHSRIDQWGWIARERLEPYLLSIPAVQGWMRRGVQEVKERAVARDNEAQEAQTLRRKYGLDDASLPTEGRQSDVVARDYDLARDPLFVLQAFLIAPPRLGRDSSS